MPQDIDRTRVTFLQGDACHLSPSLGKFDLIIASNLLDRLTNPKKFLQEIPSFLAPGGLLIISSPYCWREEYTSKEAWLSTTSNYKTSADACKALLQRSVPELTLIHEENVPFLLREHARKFELGISHLHIWKCVTLVDKNEIKRSPATKVS